MFSFKKHKALFLNEMITFFSICVVLYTYCVMKRKTRLLDWTKKNHVTCSVSNEALCTYVRTYVRYTKRTFLLSKISAGIDLCFVGARGRYNCNYTTSKRAGYTRYVTWLCPFLLLLEGPKMNMDIICSLPPSVHVDLFNWTFKLNKI